MDTKILSTKQLNNIIPGDKLMEELRVVVADAEELLQATANQAGESATAARARIQKSLQVVKQRLAVAEAAVVEHAKEAAKATDEYVHDNPWKAIGLSAGAGVIVGMLIARR